MADEVVASVSVDFNAKDGVTTTVNRMRGQFKHLRKDIDGTQAKFKKFGTSAMAVGKQMSMKMTLPIVAAGGAALKMASDFESSMTKIQSLVGRSEEEVQGLTKSVLKLSGETARAPQELADAMFFITSAGIAPFLKLSNNVLLVSVKFFTPRTKDMSPFFTFTLRGLKKLYRQGITFFSIEGNSTLMSFAIDFINLLSSGVTFA